MVRLSDLRSITRRTFLASALRMGGIGIALGWRFPGTGGAVVRHRRSHPTPLAFAPFPRFSETGIYGVGTYRAGPPRLLRDALARGATLVDTSPDYRGGETERAIGDALREIETPVFLMTQIPVGAWSGGNRVFAFRRGLRMSLGRLRRHRVEALLVRNAEPWQLRDPRFRDFAREVLDDGLVGHIGASGHAPDIERVLEEGLTDDLLTIFLVGAQLARFERMPDLLAAARDRGKILVTMKSREAALWAHLPGWEREAERRRNAPWDDRWDAGFVREGLSWALSRTGAGNAVLSLRRPEDLEIIAGA